MSDSSTAERVITRCMVAFRFKQKEKKRSKVERLMKLIREKTGVGRAAAEDIADAIVRNREIDRLALQKSWPVENGTIEGPDGSVSVEEIRGAL